MKTTPSALARIKILVLCLLFLLPSFSAVAAIYGGYSEYYIPGRETQMFAVFSDLATAQGAPISSAPGMHTVVSITATGDDTTVYYDHWEDGYEFDPEDPDNTYDMKQVLSAGEVLELVGQNIPVNPRGTATYYDGGDRIYVAGTSVTVSRTSWPEDAGPTLAISWEFFPVKPFLTDYTIPVGQDLAAAPLDYDDFERVYVLVLSVEDGNTIQIDDPTTGAVDVVTTIDKGGVTQLFHINAGTHIKALKPVQVHFIAGRVGSTFNAYEARGYNAMPDNLWDNEYINPVGAQGNGTNLYLYNPNTTEIIIEYADTSGSGMFTVPARGTRAYQDGAGRLVPANSGVYLRSDNIFWGIGSADTESRTYDWGYSLVPRSFLTDEYFLSWAPGTSDAVPAANGSPAFVTAVFDETVVFVDYSPTDGIPDQTYTLNQLQSQKIFDPDNVNTGMHIWATGPLAMAWGQDSTAAGTGNPFLDLGTANLPLPREWIDLALGVQKSADPTVLAPVAGELTTFTLTVETYLYPVADISVTDILPAGFSFVIDSARIVLPDGSQIIGTAANPSVSGSSLIWNNAQLNDLDMASGQTLTITFEAVIDGSVSNGTYSNTAQASGTRLEGTQVFSPFDSAAVYVTAMTIDKDTATPSVSAGDNAAYTLRVDNISDQDATSLQLGDTLPAGFSYIAGSATVNFYDAAGALAASNQIDPAVSGRDLVWGGLGTLGPGAYVLIEYDALVDGTVLPDTYDSTAVADFIWGGAADAVDDKGEVEQDPGTPSGQDPEADEDVTVVSLLIDKDTLSPVVAAGGMATYTIRVLNSGGATVTGVTVSDALPGGFTFNATDSMTLSGGTRTSVTDPVLGDTALNWGSWDIDPGGELFIQFTAAVPLATVPGTYDNSVLADSDQTGLIDDAGAVGQDTHTPPGADPADDENVTVQTAVLTIDKDSVTRYAVIGGTADYTIKVVNSGSSTATNVSISDTLPGGFSFNSTLAIDEISATPTASSSPSSGDTGLLWGTWDLAPGGSVQITFRANVPGTGGVYDNNTAAATSDQTGPIDDLGDVGYDSDTPPLEDPQTDEDVEVFTTATADLEIEKRHSDDFVPGSDPGNVYTITVTNNGPSAEGLIEVTDILPAGLTYASHSDLAAWTLVSALPSQTLVFQYGGPALAVGEAAVLTLYVSVDADTVQNTVTNTAGISASTNDHIAANNSVADETTISISNLSASTKTVLDLNGGDPEPGDVLRYTIRLTESVGIAAGGVSVTDDIPASVTGFTVISVPPGSDDQSDTLTGPGHGANETGFLDIRDITVPASASVEIVFEVTIASGAGQGTGIANSAVIANPEGPDITVAAPAVTVLASQIPGSGNKPLYLYENLDLSRAVPALAQGSVELLNFNNANNGDPPPTASTWAITQTLTRDLHIDSAVGTIPVSLWLTRSGDTNTWRNLYLLLEVTDSSSITTRIGQMERLFNNSPIAILDTTTPRLEVFDVPIDAVWPAGSPGDEMVLSAGSEIRLTLASITVPGVFGANRHITVWPDGDGGGQRSRIDLASNTVINVDSVTFYDAAYPGGNQVSYVVPGTPVYTRALVSDPFGSFDVTGARVDIIDSEGTIFADDALMSEVNDSGAGSKTYEYAFTVPAAGPVDNWTASVTATEGSEGTVTDTGVGVIIVTAVSGADLSVSKSHSDTFFKNNTARFTIQAANYGPDAQSAPVIVRDTLPAGLSYQSSSGSGWTVNTAALPTVVWTYGAVPVAAGTQLPPITLTVAVDSDAPESLQNTATVDPGVGENNPANNSSTDTVYIVVRDVVKTVNANSPYYAGDNTGDELTYTISVTNTGSGTIENVTVSDPVPAGTSYVSGSSLVTAPQNALRVSEYYLAAGQFSGSSYTLTLDQDLTPNYFVIVQGSDGDGTSNNNRGPDENYAALTADPFGTGDLALSGGPDRLSFSRGNAVNSWVGVITVVEALSDFSGSGFLLRDVARVAHGGASTGGTDTVINGWTNLDQTMLVGGFNGAGCNTAETDAARHPSCHVRIWPTGSDVVNWTRNGNSLDAGTTATSTVMAVEWGSDWTVQHVRVQGNNGGNGVNAAGEYNTAGITPVLRGHTWVWGTGHTNDNGIGDAAEGVLLTLGNGVDQNATESLVAAGIEYANNAVDFEVYTLTHADLAVDYRFKADGDSGLIVYDLAVDPATGNRMALITNGSNSTQTRYPRPIWSARYVANDTVRLERRRSGENFPAWVQGIDFSGIQAVATAQPAGDPPSLVTAGDGIDLQPGESMTVTFRVTIDDPAQPGPINNTVAVTSDQTTEPSVFSVTTQVRTFGAVDFTDAAGNPLGSFDYPNGLEPLYLKVYDPDRNEYPDTIETVTLLVSNPDTGDSLTVTLYETGPDTGLFANDQNGERFELPLSSCEDPVDCYPTEDDEGNPLTPPSAADTLWVEPGTSPQLTADYVDPGDPAADVGQATAFLLTRASVSRFEAYAENGQVVVLWETSAELGTIGFNLWRQNDGDGTFTRMHSAMLPGLLRSPRGGIYRFTDVNALPGERYTYRLEEVESRGRKILHGPYPVTVEAAAPSDLPDLAAMEGLYDRIPHQAVLTAGAGAPPVSLLRSTLAAVPLSSGDAIRIAISDSGLFFVSTAQIAAHLGLSEAAVQSGLAQGEVALRHRGRTVAYYPPADGSGLYFYGQAIDSPYTSENIYWLTADSGLKMETVFTAGDIDGVEYTDLADGILALKVLAGIHSDAVRADYATAGTDVNGNGRIDLAEAIQILQMLAGVRDQSATEAGPVPAETEQTYASALHAEQETQDAVDFFDDPAGDFWFWEWLWPSADPQYGTNPDIRNFTLLTESLSSAPGTAALTVHLFGGSSASHQVDVYVNDNETPVGSAEWAGTVALAQTFSFSASLLNEGVNTVRLEGLDVSGSGDSVVYVDGFDLSYPRRYQASGNRLLLQGQENTLVTVEGFSSPGVLVFDVSDPDRPEIVSAVTLDGTAGNYRASFEPAGPQRDYLVAVPDPASVPQALAAVSFTRDLKSTANAADYVVITPESLAATARSLVDYRQSRGLVAMQVTLEEIMAGFNDGIHSPEAIRDFLAYAYHNWSRAPRYAVLVGKGTFDYKDIYAYGNNLLPPLLMQTPDGLKASDNRFADIVGNDGVPEMAIGRLSVKSAAELGVVIDKIIAYESTPDESWKRRVLMVADNPDSGGDFPADSEQLAQVLSADPDYVVDNIFLSEQTVSVAHQNLIAGINTGALLLNYIGHGGYEFLADPENGEWLLDGDDIVLMENAGRLPVVTALTCITGRFEFPDFDSLGERMMLSATGGAIAVWSPSGLSINAKATMLAEEFFTAVFETGERILGDAVRKALSAYRDRSGDTLMPGIYNLLGDPALTLQTILPPQAQ